MKKITLLVASILLVGNVAKASVINATDVVTMSRFEANEPISFIERGIAFFVFPNGDFDFNTRPEDSEGDYFYRTAGRKGTSTVSRRPVNYGVRIEHDSFGRVRRIGNTFINYDYNDRVSRIGSVYMRYNRFALVQIGGMKIIYNRNGEIVDTIGSIKGWRNNGFTYNNNNTTCSNNDFDYNVDYTTAYNSNEYYYYRHDGSKVKIEDKK